MSKSESDSPVVSNYKGRENLSMCRGHEATVTATHRGQSLCPSSASEGWRGRVDGEEDIHGKGPLWWHHSGGGVHLGTDSKEMVEENRVPQAASNLAPSC